MVRQAHHEEDNLRELTIAGEHPRFENLHGFASRLH
jgi:hypothetical protein